MGEFPTNIGDPKAPPDRDPQPIPFGFPGRSVVLHLSRTGASHLMDQLIETIRRSERMKQGRG
jgi:hypothetical protein